MNLNRNDIEYLISTTVLDINKYDRESDWYKRRRSTLEKLLDMVECKTKDVINNECKVCKYLRNENKKYFCAIDGCTKWDEV